jgi:RNA polymerase sigma factor (sigma-70 family)
MNTDNQLLAEYANKGSEEAFRELVQRHINMVHAAALRETRGNAALAEDITQEVFTELARRAKKLSSHPAVAGWIYTCVRQMTANIRRSENRRQRREQENFLMNELLGSHPDDQLWQQVRPVLDDVMHELDHEDRTAVVLRFFEGLSLKEVGVALGLTENAARMRVERSLEKLHARLSRRGIRSTASTLTAALVVGAVLKTPSDFAASVATGALAKAASGHAAAFTVGKVLSLMKSKSFVIGSLGILLSGIILWKHFESNATETRMSTPSAVPAAVSPVAEQAIPEPSDLMDGAPSNAVVVPQMALQLVDADTAEPLRSAKLYLFYLLNDGRGKVIHAVADARGRWGVDFPQAPYRALNLFVTADGHVPMVTSFGFERPMPSDYTMKIKAGVRIGGVVVDEAGSPVANAKIEFDGPGNDASLADNIQFGPDASVTTDAAGQWSCNMIPKEYESISLRARDGEHAETNVTVRPAAADANKLVITLAPGISVKGLVVDKNGNPIAEAKLRQVKLNEEHEPSTTTDASGAFEFKAISPGELMLAVQADGFAPAVQTVQLTGNVDELKFQLGPGQILRGRIVDEDGRSVPNAFIETTRRGIDKVQWSTNADANGQFEWTSAPTEPLLYSVLAEGFNRAYAQKLPADGTEQVITLSRKRPESDDIHITGTAVDAETGQPLDTFKVSVGELDPQWAYPWRFYMNGKSGQFALSLPLKSSHPGYAIEIEQKGYLPAVSANFQTTNGNQKLQFKLQKGSGPAGVVLLPNGEPAINAAVLLCTSRAGVTLDGPAHVEKGINTTSCQTATDGSGRFALEAAIDPQGLIIVHEQGFAQVALVDLKTVSNVTLQPWGSVKGKSMQGSQAAPHEHVVAFHQVRGYTDSGRDFGFLTFRLETVTDADGNFSFEKVPPGPCNIFHQISSDGWSISSGRASVKIIAGAVTEVVLGGTGRMVLGKAIVPGATRSIEWEKVPVQLLPKTGNEASSRPKREDFPTLEAFVAASENFFKSFENHFGALCASDGSFRISDVPPGTYELKIEIRDSKQNSVTPHVGTDPSPVVGSVTREIVIPDDKSAEPVDVGTVELVPQQANVSAR